MTKLIPILALFILHAGPVLAASPAPISPERLTGEAPGFTVFRCGTEQFPLEVTWRPVPGTPSTCDVFLQRTAGSEPETMATILGPIPCDRVAATLVCRADGSGIAVAGDRSGVEESISVLDFDAQGVATSPARAITTQPRCEFPQRWVLLGEELSALGPCYDEDWREYSLALRRFPAASDAEAGLIVLTAPGYDVIQHVVDAARDEAGNTLVAWTEYFGNDSYDQPDYRLLARGIGADGNVLGETFQVDSTLPARGFLQSVIAEEPGIFSVYWNNFQLEGSVVRTVSIDPDLYSRAAVTTTTLPSPEAPTFDVVRTIGGDWTDEGNLQERALHSMTGDGKGGLYLSRRLGVPAHWYDGRLPKTLDYRSEDAGARWSRLPMQLATEERWPLWTPAMSSGGTLLRVALIYKRSDYSGYEIVTERSTDHGATWSQRAVVAPILCGDCYEFDADDMKLAGDGSGTWMLAITTGEHIQGGPVESWQAKIVTSFSYDDGLTWSGENMVWTEDISVDEGDDEDTAHHLAIAPAADGSWALAWRSQANGAIRLARSPNAGTGWTTSLLVPPWQRPANLEPWEWYDPLTPYPPASLATTADGTWIVAWEERHLPGYGSDGDIFFRRSSDGGETWSEPAPLNAYAAIDGARDADPSLAAGPDGRVLAAWSSHDPLGDTAGFDADIVSSLSVDDGSTWSAPTLVDAASLSDDRQERGPVALSDTHGRWTIAWTSLPNTNRWWRNDDDGATVKVAVAGTACGNGVIDAGEDCDDGNSADGDGCNADCGLPGCGNGLVEPGESCDDGNLANDDACNAACQPGMCGDGDRDLWSERCDDGNTSDNDACTTLCTRARCGDGLTWALEEECDDANTVETDACRTRCEATFCGDGIVREGVEECDDRDAWAGNACTNECKLARCGDGYVLDRVEECDPADPMYARNCTDDCKLTFPCSDPDGSGASTATDALIILRSAVGLDEDCPLERCDLNGSGRVTASDAYTALRHAAGFVVSLDCPSAGYASFILDDSRLLGSLQVRMAYANTGVDFANGNGRSDCELRLPGLLFGDSIDPFARVLNLAFVSLNGFAGPIELARCRLYTRDDDEIDDQPLVVNVVDVTGPAFEKIEPAPVVRVVLH